MAEAGTWPSVEKFVTCDEFTGEKVESTKDLDLLGAIKQVDYPWSYAPFRIESNGANFMEYDVNIEKWTFHRSSPYNSIDVGSWKAGLDTKIVEKSPGSLENLAARPMYRVVTNEVWVSILKRNLFTIFFSATTVCNKIQRR